MSAVGRSAAHRLRRTWGTSDVSAKLGGLLLTGFVLVALLAPLLAPYDADQRAGQGFAAPSGAHPLGLDDGGYDVLSLTILAARTSLLIGVSAGLLAVVIGVTLGLLAGYSRGRVDLAVLQLTELLLVLPSLPLMIIVAALWGATLLNVILVIGLLAWPSTTLLIRAQTRTLRERAYVQRAASMGATDAWIIRRHILPHTLPLVSASVTLSVGAAIFAEAGLAFLGLADPSAPSWGRMINAAFESAAVSYGAWWAIVPPGLAITIVVLATTLVGRALEDSANPRDAIQHLGRGLPRRRAAMST